MKIFPIGDDSDFESVVLIEQPKGHITPHCKKHGAMNKFEGGIWRCVTSYTHIDTGNTLPKFVNKACYSGCCEYDRSEEKK